MKNTNHNCTEPFDKQAYKKKYLLRKLEEADAEQEIKDFNYEEEDEHRPDERNPY